MKKVLLIGGSGFLGSHLLEALGKTGFDVYVVRNKKPITRVSADKIIPGGIRAINQQLIDELRPDLIFHAARPALSKWRRWGRKLAAMKATRYNQQLLKALLTSQSKPPLVFASGSLMYGNCTHPHDEDSPLNPVSFARQYYRGEVPIIKVAQSQNYPLKVFRLPWLLGNGSWFRWFYQENIKNRKLIPSFGNMTNMMEIIDVRDAVNLMIKLSLETDDKGIFNIPAQKAISQQQFLNELSGFSGAEIADYKKMYPGKIEMEVLEAFTSNILIKTKYPQYFNSYTYYALRESFNKFVTLTP